MCVCGVKQLRTYGEGTRGTVGRDASNVVRWSLPCGGDDTRGGVSCPLARIEPVIGPSWCQLWNRDGVSDAGWEPECERSEGHFCEREEGERPTPGRGGRNKEWIVRVSHMMMPSYVSKDISVMAVPQATMIERGCKGW